MNSAAVDVHLQVFMGMYSFINLDYTPKNEIAGPYVKPVLDNCQTIFQSDNIFLFPPAIYKESASPYPHLSLLMSVFG